jgi:hypothetical protein
VLRTAALTILFSFLAMAASATLADGRNSLGVIEYLRMPHGESDLTPEQALARRDWQTLPGQTKAFTLSVAGTCNRNENRPDFM